MSSADSSMFDATTNPQGSANDQNSRAPQPHQEDASSEAAVSGGESKRDVKRGIMALADQAVCSGTNFLTMVMLARSLGKAGFGVFSLAFLGFQFARTIQERTLAAPYLVLSLIHI